MYDIRYRNDACCVTVASRFLSFFHWSHAGLRTSLTISVNVYVAAKYSSGVRSVIKPQARENEVILFTYSFVKGLNFSLGLRMIER